MLLCELKDRCQYKVNVIKHKFLSTHFDNGNGASKIPYHYDSRCRLPYNADLPLKCARFMVLEPFFKVLDFMLN